MKDKNTFLTAILLVGVLLGLNPRSSAAQETQRTISVTGEAIVKVIPDEVIITLGVETYHRELGVAKRKNDERIADVIRIVKRHHVPDREIQTDFINIQPRYQDTYDRTIVEGYFVRKTVVLTLHNLARFDQFLSDVTEAGVTHVHGIQFRTTELRKYRDQARALALQAAKEKAADMAQVLNSQAGSAQIVREDQVGWYSWYGYGWWGSQYGFASQNVVQTVGGPSLELDSTLAPGEISVSAKVMVTFDLIP